MPKLAASDISARSRKLMPNERYVLGSAVLSDRYFKASPHCVRSDGSASTDQSSCHRLLRSAGRSPELCTGDACVESGLVSCACAARDMQTIVKNTAVAAKRTETAKIPMRNEGRGALRFRSMTSVTGGVDLGHVTAGELHHGRFATLAGIRRNQYLRIVRFCFGQRVGQATDLVTRHLVPIGIRQMAVRYEYRHLSEGGFNADATECVAGASNLHAGCLGFVGNHLAVRERHEPSYKGISTIRRYIHTILGNGLEGRIVRRRGVPVQLHVYAAGPLDHCVTTDRIRKGLHNHIGAGRTRNLDGHVQISHQVASALSAER